MIWNRLIPGSFFLAMLVPALACGAGPSSDGSPAEAALQAGAEPQTGQLPQGHPPIGGADDMKINPPEPYDGTGETGLVWKAPEEWTSEKPINQMRKAQYRVSGAGGDGECVVYYFGPGQGGDAMSNAERWAMQLSQPDGSSPLDAMRTEKIEANGVPVLLVEVTGTYQVGQQMGGSGEAAPGHMLLGAVAEGPDANWFFKFTGPEDTVIEQKATFRKMVESIQVGS